MSIILGKVEINQSLYYLWAKHLYLEKSFTLTFILTNNSHAILSISFRYGKFSFAFRQNYLGK